MTKRNCSLKNGPAGSRRSTSVSLMHGSVCIEQARRLPALSHPRLKTHETALIDFEGLFNLPAEDERLAGELLLRGESGFEAALGTAGDVFQPRHEVVDNC